MADDGDLYEVLGKIAREAVKQPDVDPRKMAERSIRAIPAHVLRELAVREVMGIVDSVRRAEAKRIEELATRVAARPIQPDKLVPTSPTRVDAANWLEIRDPRRHGNARDRQKFVKALGDQFEAWHGFAQAFLEEEADSLELELFVEDWHPGGVKARQRDITAARIGTIIEEQAALIRLEITAELLGSEFAIGDGRRVTWGWATAREHEARIEMLTGQTAGVIDTAARHAVAIKMIREGGVACLGELGLQQAA